MLLVCRLRPPVGAEPGADADPGLVRGFVERVRQALQLLTAQPGCLEATLAQATDEPGAWVLLARFESVAAYRRAMSPFPVREHVAPLLAEALADEPSIYEPRLAAAGGQVTELTSLVARDAGTVRLGEAAGPAAPR